MKNKLITLAILTVGSLSVFAENSLQIVFSDSEFASGDWFYEVGAWGGGAGFSTQELSGGNPGAYRLINLSMTAGTGGAGLYAFKSTAVHDPSTQGAIASVAFSEDLRMVVGSVPGMSSGSMLLQNGLRYYRWCWETDSVSWTNRTAHPTGSHDYLLDGLQDNGSNPIRPDFSANGAPITFGYFRNIQGVAGTNFFMTSGIDNWTTTVVTVPEPSAWQLIAAAALVGIVWMLRRHSLLKAN